ncbi:hypothetical protein FO519_004910 [Halicephalobus sp. NKZ332]|nr:hypothetical protein FO519_004910 [Halicephalobus sp. NKZ332]
MFFPISQSLIYWKVCLGSQEFTNITREECGDKKISSSNQYLQTEANRIFLIGSIVMTLTAIFAGTLIGKFGDERSRKLALFIPFIGLFLADLVLIFLSFFLDSSSYFYILSEAVFGLTGGYVTILSSSFAYGSHLAKVSGFERSRAMSVLEGAIGCGSE